MKVTLAVGRLDGVVSSYQLICENGLRLRSDDLRGMGWDERKLVQRQFSQLIVAMRAAGWTVEGFLFE